jgi:nucleoside-triphosphatase THEP1
MRENKEFIDICMTELEKDADIYLLDEIGERFFFNNHIQDKIVSLMEDPGNILIASAEPNYDRHGPDLS